LQLTIDANENVRNEEAQILVKRHSDSDPHMPLSVRTDVPSLFRHKDTMVPKVKQKAIVFEMLTALARIYIIRESTRGGQAKTAARESHLRRSSRYGE